ncbi:MULTISPECIES: DUF1838 family protein [Actinomadura]|uniref:DUF1838 family protein n=1 Tax=Actinomadura yumaensis TaxID=111807 RepID=A0ABW2CC40_9ACTN|nr:DUF1838 family protein [Actinomadura sp. J1-007]MWK38353.1 DUF1838 domain-containing protein [Actinomadura sp. J1-007]
MHRRVPAALAATAVTVAIAAAPGAASARPSAEPTDPGPLYARVKDLDSRLQLQTLGRPDGKDMVFRISGSAYVNAPGDTLAPGLRHGTKLFGFEGYNIRRLYREPGTDKLYNLTREIVFYTDPNDPTRILREWRNPLDGKTYPVVPVNNDAVNNGPFTVTRDLTLGQYQRVHDALISTSDIPPRTDLAAKTGDEFGLEKGVYASWEMFDFFIDRHEAGRRGRGVPKGALQVVNSWTRSGPFVPFMCVPEKNTRANLVYHARSWTMDSWSDLEPWLKDIVARDYPLYKTSPSVPGPNETSWTSFWHKQLGNGKTTWNDWCAAHGRA